MTPTITLDGPRPRPSPRPYLLGAAALLFALSGWGAAAYLAFQPEPAVLEPRLVREWRIKVQGDKCEKNLVLRESR